MKKTLIAIVTVLMIAAGFSMVSSGTEACAEAGYESTAPFLPDGCVIFEKDGNKVTTAGLCDERLVYTG